MFWLITIETLFFSHLIVFYVQRLFLLFDNLLTYVQIFCSTHIQFDVDLHDIPVDTGRKLNVHKTFRTRPGRLLNVLCTFNLRPVSTGILYLGFYNDWLYFLQIRVSDLGVEDFCKSNSLKPQRTVKISSPVNHRQYFTDLP